MSISEPIPINWKKYSEMYHRGKYRWNSQLFSKNLSGKTVSEKHAWNRLLNQYISIDSDVLAGFCGDHSNKNHLRQSKINKLGIHKLELYNKLLIINMTIFYISINRPACK